MNSIPGYTLAPHGPEPASRVFVFLTQCLIKKKIICQNLKIENYHIKSRFSVSFVKNQKELVTGSLYFCMAMVLLSGQTCRLDAQAPIPRRPHCAALVFLGSKEMYPALGTFMVLPLTSLHTAQFNVIGYGFSRALAGMRNIGSNQNAISKTGDEWQSQSQLSGNSLGVYSYKLS